MGKSNFSEKRKAVSECRIQEEYKKRSVFDLMSVHKTEKTVDCSDM